MLTWCGFTLFPVSSKIDKLFQRQPFVYYKQTSETFNSFTQNKTLAHRQRLNPDFTRSSNHFYIKISPPPADQIYIKLVFNIKFYIKMPDYRNGLKMRENLIVYYRQFTLVIFFNAKPFQIIVYQIPSLARRQRFNPNFIRNPNFN